jgi:photosystem II stability/assembly factor-like uncharacterized protein
MTPATFARSLLLALLTVTAGQAADVRPNMLLLDGAVTGAALVAVGERGTILRSANAGLTWQAAAVPTAATLTGVSFAPGSAHGWAVGHDALILATADGGLTWRKQWQADNLQDSFLDVLALDVQHIIAVGAYGLFVTSGDGGLTWNRRKLSDDDFHFNRITRGLTGTLYLAGEHGTLLRSRDQGVSWAHIESPYDGSFYGILPLGERTLIAYGLRGRIYRSTDDGATWRAVPNEHRVLIATAVKVKGGVLAFAGQSRALFVSRDDGVSVIPWPTSFTSAVAELILLPDGTVLALGESGAAILPSP